MLLFRMKTRSLVFHLSFQHIGTLRWIPEDGAREVENLLRVHSRAEDDVSKLPAKLSTIMWQELEKVGLGVQIRKSYKRRMIIESQVELKEEAGSWARDKFESFSRKCFEFETSLL